MLKWQRMKFALNTYNLLRFPSFRFGLRHRAGPGVSPASPGARATPPPGATPQEKFFFYTIHKKKKKLYIYIRGKKKKKNYTYTSGKKKKISS
jgi:hypothetical protein